MKKLLISLFCLLTVNVSAQIVQFSDELLSQYDNKKQDSILERPIDLDMIYPPFSPCQISRLYQLLSSERKQGIISRGEVSATPNNKYNYIGYHVYVPQSEDNEYVLSFNSTYDTVALDVMPEGVYEVVGMLVSNEEAEDIRNLVIDSHTICKDNSITFLYFGGETCRYVGSNDDLSDKNFRRTEEFTYRDLLKYYCDDYLRTIDSVAGINRTIHNGAELKKDRTTVVLKGDNDHLYYISYKIRENTFGSWNTWHNNWHVPYIASIDLQKAFIVEQYEYMKEFLLKNEFLIKDSEFTITTDKGLEYNFSDTIGLKICDLAVKEGDNHESMDFIAVMKIGPDSILFYDATSWEKLIWRTKQRCADSTFYTDTISYLNVNFGKAFSVISKSDAEKINQAKQDLADRVMKYKAELEAARVAEYEQNEKLRAEREVEMERKRQEQLAAQKVEQEKERQKREAEQREWKRKRQAEKQSLIAKYGAKYGALVFDHKVTLGMTKEMCLKAWGKPRNKVIRRVRFGTQEVWYYGVSQYLVFDNGVLVECASRS
jgi:hypothetical protein